ncbi:MAG: hypothetical protein AB7P22_20130, partial [Vicinamibacterales bacterium]
LSLLAWYCRRRLPALPAWLVWSALLTLPWTLNFSTHVVNTSFILPAGIAFFLGFLEASPAFRAGLLPLPLAWALMGAAIPFVAQVHMSWVLLPPYVAFAAIDLVRRNRGRTAVATLAFLIGAASTGSLLLPTILRYGWSSGDAGSVVGFYPGNAVDAVTVAARFLSFPAFETNRFLGMTTADRVMVFWRQPWALPFAIFVTILGFVQPVMMAIAWFRRSGARDAEWDRVRWLAALTVLWIGVAFMFSARRPLAHTFYVTFPVAFLYAAYWWARSATPRWHLLAVAAIAAGVVMHAGLALDRAPRLSLYVDRPLVERAIAVRNDRFLGDRRDSLQETQDRQPRAIDPVPDPDGWLHADPTTDLVITASEWAPLGIADVSLFNLSIHNRSRAAAYLDLRYATRYLNADGDQIAAREGVIKEIVQPGEERSWRELTDGTAPEGAASAEITLVTAEKCIPAARIS